MIQGYSGGVSKIAAGLSAVLLSLSTLTLAGVGVVEYVVPVFNQPTSFSDFVSLDKDGKAISCDDLSQHTKNENLGLDEITNSYHLKQCQLVVKKSTESHCSIYADTVYSRISATDNSDIDLNQGNASLCSAQLDKKLEDYNEAYSITEKGGEKFLYIKKYDLIILGSKIGPDTVSIIQSKLDNNLWYVQFTAEDKNSDNGYTQRFLYFTNKDKATNFYTDLKNIHNSDTASTTFSNILSSSLAHAQEANKTTAMNQSDNK
jgi:hypothetical protein